MKAYTDFMEDNPQAAALFAREDLPIREVAMELSCSIDKARRFRSAYRKQNGLPPLTGATSTKGRIKYRMNNPEQYDMMCEELIYGDDSVPVIAKRYGLDGKVTTQSLYNIRTRLLVERGEWIPKKRRARKREMFNNMPFDIMDFLMTTLADPRRKGYTWDELLTRSGLDMEMPTFRKYALEALEEWKRYNKTEDSE